MKIFTFAAEIFGLNQAQALKSVNELRTGKGTAYEMIEVEDE